MKIIILLFAHKRPQHLQATLNALSNNISAGSLPLRVYVDGARNPNEVSAVSDVVKAAKSAHGFRNVSVVTRDSNHGLYDSLTSGISEAFNEYDAVLVFEDDILTSPYALQFLLDGLEVYKDASEVCSIHAYTPPIVKDLPNTFFLRGSDCWGWATWRDQWQSYRHDASEMAREIKRLGLIHEFNLNGNYPYYRMLRDRANGKNNSWAICWHASCFLSNKLTLYPGRSLVKNIGLDYSGEHCGPSDIMNSSLSPTPIILEPIKTEVDQWVFDIYSSHFQKSVFKRFYKAAKVLIKNIPLLLATYQFFRPNRLPLEGRYRSFEEASKACSGYSDSAVLAKVSSAVAEVLKGHGQYERDGTVFTALPDNLRIRQVLGDIVRGSDCILDFGGGLGGTYINHRDILPPDVNYFIVEQPVFALKGREIAAEFNLQIFFAESISHLPSIPRIAIFSSVLQYLPDPYSVLLSVLAFSPEYLVIDRTIFSNDSSWRLQVNRDYYESIVSYPCRGINFSLFLALCKDYKVIDKWTNRFDARFPRHLGILLERKA